MNKYMQYYYDLVTKDVTFTFVVIPRSFSAGLVMWDGLVFVLSRAIK